MNTVTVTLSNHKSFSTNINGDDQSICDYYIGKYFNMGVVDDDMQKCVAIEINGKLYSA